LSRGFAHKPVMEAEVVELLSTIPPGLVVDATVGGGGHAAALLRSLPDIRLLGLDRDLDAVAAATERLDEFGSRATVRHARFDRMAELVDVALHADAGADGLARDAGRQSGLVSAVLFDLGVSSPQLDGLERGFSYRGEAALDMRMDRTEARTAAEVLDTIDERALAELLAANGEGRFARRIARALVERRPFTTTTELADAVRDSVPAAARRRGHPAKRVFQALRIEVNRELELLGPAVDEAIDLLVPRGRCVVLSYHSGEDRLVKERFASARTGGCTCPAGLPCVCGAVPLVRVLTPGARMPSAAEVDSNPRAESARLRAAERLGSPAGAGTA
jgi:16S rRNA (cytosine1402-N4)-methyltransferase